MATGFGWPALGDGAMDERVRTVLSDPTFQTELPIDDLPQGSDRRAGTARGGPSSMRAPVIPPGRESARQASGAESGNRSCAVTFLRPIGGTVIRAFLWVLVAAVLLVLVFAVAEAVIRHWRRRRRVTDAPARAPVAARGRRFSADEAAALAAAGRYAEAVHLLLRWVLAGLEERTGGPLPPSFTSREILRRSRLAAGDRPCLETLVRTVERSWFGGLPVAREEYELCVDACEQLTCVRRAR